MQSSPRIVAALLVLLVAGPLAAQSPAPAGGTDLRAHATRGPASVTLGDNLAKLDLPADLAIFDKQATVELLKANGDFPTGRELGLIVPTTKDAGFFVVARFDAMGYVRSDDAGKIDAAGLLKTISDATEELNEERKAKGFGEIHVTRWAEPPRFDAERKHVVWALEGKTKEGTVVNYNTRILGRRGVLSMNLVTDPAKLDTHKKVIEDLLARFAYNPGNRYQDYQKGVDTDSGMGVTDLIVGGSAAAVAAKLGIFGKLGKLLLTLLLVFKKFAVVIVVGAVALLSKLFSRKTDDDQTPGGEQS